LDYAVILALQMENETLESLNGVGPSTDKLFASIGIDSIWELLNYFPRAYNDYSLISPIAKSKPGIITIKAQIKQSKGRYVRRGMHITEAIASDESGSVRLIWFNQPYRTDALKSDSEYFITGKLELSHQRFAIQNPSIELVSNMPVHTARIVPVYRETKSVNTKLIRKTMAEAVKQAHKIPPVLPNSIVKKFGLIAFPQAIKEIHFPTSAESLQTAQRSLGFLEVFELMLASKYLKQEIASELAPVIPFDDAIAKKFINSLPFKLTDAQRLAAWEILKDISSNSPANRLIEGDVGSGKTVVAAMAAVMALNAGYQVAMLAPTELLARQHADSFLSLLKPVGMDNKLSLLVGSLKAKQKTTVHEAIKSGKCGMIVGTHAILQDKVVIGSLGLAIVDEQHRFGVEQRKALLKNTGKMPHIVSMTATPIPRSLALTLYGELSISLLDAMPPGRKAIKTTIISPNSRTPMYDHIRQEVKKNHQVYIVCPIISDGKLETISAESMFKQLSSNIFRDLKVGLIHGKLKADEKNRVMEQFVNGKIDILVATTVIEVGVNVPNATIMVIEGADRFGLAQMHQLRGRVGRSTDQGYCYIVPTDSKQPSRRLRALVQSTNGFKLAEMDLELRGPGAIYGTMQHGILDLRFANLSDHKLIADAKKAVAEFISSGMNLIDYPELSKRVRLAQAVVTLN
jgi:ATP-dependent DNA helicase RecG